jgi:hypothetical protein
MPTVLRSGPYRFFFYSMESREPPHIHVERVEDVAKILVRAGRARCESRLSFSRTHPLRRMVTEHREKFLEAWHEHFGS